MNFSNLITKDIEKPNDNKKKQSYGKIIINSELILIVLLALVILIIFIGNIVLYFYCNMMDEKNKTAIAESTSYENKVKLIKMQVNVIEDEIGKLRNDNDKKEAYQKNLNDQYNYLIEENCKKSEIPSLQNHIKDIRLQINFTQKETVEIDLKKLTVESTYHQKKNNHVLLSFQLQLIKRKLNIDIDPNENEKYQSVILKSEEHYKLLAKWIFNGISFKMNLLYRGSKSLFNWHVFHDKCSLNHITNTLVLIQLEDETIIGGFTHNNWSVENTFYKEDNNSLIFNLSTKIMFPINTPKEAIYSTIFYGPIFGRGDIAIYSQNKVTIGFPRSYGKDIINNELTNNVCQMKMKDIEVFYLTQE